MLNQFLFSVVLIFCVSTFSYAQKQFSDLLFYEVDEHNLSDANQRTLDSLVLRFYSYNDYTIEIIGHADAQGSEGYNKKIAARRASVVQQYLSSAGIPNNKIKVNSKGSTDPLDKSKFAKINGGDRRVEIRSYATVFADVDALLDQLGPQTQYITIDNRKDNNLTLIDGTEIFVPAHSLVYSDGSGDVKELVTIAVKESYDVIDFVAEDLHTKTANELLQTGGMIYLNAEAGGKQLGIKTGKLLDIKYPEKKVSDGMLLYDAVENDHGISWTLAEGEISTEGKSEAEAELDITSLLEMAIESPVMPQIEFGTMPKIPIVPAKPTQPIQPKEPNKNDIDYDAKLAKYEKSYKLYQKRFRTYEGLKLNYDTVKPRAESELRMWQLEVEERMTQIKEYEREMKDYTCNTKLYNAITYVQENYGSIPSSELFKTFKEMVYTDLALKDVKDPYKEAFNNFKKQVIRHKKIKGDYLNYNSYSRKSLFNTTVKPLIDNIESQNIENNLSVTKTLSEGELDRYMFSVGSFGYHNVDKPIDYEPEELLELTLTDDAEGTKYYVVLKGTQSVLGAQYGNGSYTLEGLPKDHDVMIVGVKLVDSVPHMAVTDINTGGAEQFALNMNFEETNLHGIRSELETLNEYAGI